MTEHERRVPVLGYIPNVLRSEELNPYVASEESIQAVGKLMTAKDLLDVSEFSRPKVINPYEYPDFSSLVQDRQEIRQLRLLPLKSDEEYKRYHDQTKDYLYSRVLSYLGDSPMALAYNAFPYYLPEDLAQYLVWIKDTSTPESEVLSFMAKSIEHLQIKPEELILFERSLKTTSKFVKGTFSEMRHIHFWFRLP